MPRSGEATRQKILDAAERLFAERGIDGVTIAEITAASDQRNNSAVQYHFGGKLDLLLAVTARRVDRIGEHRAKLTARLPEDPSLEQLVRVVVEPLAECLHDPSGVRYLQIQAALVVHPDRDTWPAMLSRPWERAGFAEVTEPFAERVEPGDQTTAELRRMLLTSLMFHSLADRARTHGSREHDRFVTALVRSTVAILQADFA